MFGLDKDPNWPEIQEAYFRWEFKTLSDVARYIGRRPSDKRFRDATAGWKELRDQAESKALPQTLDALAKGRAVQKAQDFYADILAANFSLLTILANTLRQGIRPP